MRAAHDHRYSLIWDDLSLDIEVLSEEDPLMMFAMDWDPKFGYKVAEKAVQYGNFEVLKLLHDYHCPIDSSVATMAAGKGHLDILKWLNVQHETVRVRFRGKSFRNKQMLQ